MTHTRPPLAPATGALALTALALSTFMSALDTSIANLALPTLARTFAAPFHAVQWVLLAYLLAITTLIVSVGRLGDLLGRRRLLAGGILLFTTASLLCGAAPSLPWLIVGRAAQGLGAAAMMALALAFVGDVIPKERIGRATGLLGTVSALGTALGPTLGGLLITGCGWRALFLVNVPIGLINLVLVLRVLPADAPARREGAALDPQGTLLLALTLAAYALALTLGRDLGGRSTLLMAGAGMGAALFIRQQARSASPLVHLARLREAGLRRGLLLNLLVAAVLMSTLVVGPFYLGRGLGLPATRVGLALSVGPLVAALTGLPAGRLVDRLGPEPVTAWALSGLIGGTLLLALLPASLGLAGYLAPLALTTGSYALFQAANTTAVVGGIPADQRGALSGLLQLSRNLGLITGASFMGTV